MNDSAILVQDLSVKYGRTLVLRGISFTLKVGEYLAVVGPNGAGKSTLLRALSGVVGLTAGRVELHGENWRLLSAARRAQLVGYAPQYIERGLELRVDEFVALGLHPELGRFRPFSERHAERVREVLLRVGMQDVGIRRMSSLSGGEAQRVLLAAVLVRKPQILLLDEPASFLDPRQDNDIHRLLRELCRVDRVAVISVSHDINASAMVADKVLALKKGQHFFFGTAADFMRSAIVNDLFDFQHIFVPHPLTGMPMIVPSTGDSR